jgi:hypothetical protein
MAENPTIMNEARIPTDKVLQMRAQGLSNNQIIQTLQREGRDLPLIFNAMNQADIKSGIDYGSFGPQPGGSTMANEQEFPESQNGSGQQPIGQLEGMQQPMAPGMGQSMDQMGMSQSMGTDPMAQPMQSRGNPMMGGQPIGAQSMQGMEQQMGDPMMDMGQPADPMMGSQPMGMDMGAMQQGFMQSPMQGPMPSGYESQRIEELAEAIIDEKWNEIVRSINKIIDWKERVEARINKLEQRVDDMQKNFDVLHKGVLGKIGDYDQHLQNVGAEIKAMEKVFQKVIPSLTENVSELGRIAKDMKRK